jgi:flagellar motor protein MotB
LQQIADDMKNILNYMPDQLFIISGYTADSPGDEDDKIELSKQRADMVKNILADFGVLIDKYYMCLYRGTNKWGNNLSEETMKQNCVITIELKK